MVRLQQLPSFLNSSHDDPSTSVTMLGSMVPPSSDWHTIGPVESSTNGPVGEGATARDTHWRFVAVSAVV